MMKLAEVARMVVDGARPDELRVLSDWLIAQPGLDEAQRLWWLWFLSVHCDDHRLGQPWLDTLLAHPALSHELRRNLCLAWLSPRPPGRPPPDWRALDQALTGESVNDDEADANDEDDNALTSFGVVSHLMRQALGGYVFVPRYLERLAMTGLVRAGDDPLAVCQKYLGAQRPTPTEALNQGVADVLHAYHTQMPPDAVHALIERGLALPQVTTRKAFYALAADLYGPSIWQRAQQDSAKSIRVWAAKKR